jgi:type III restriction enzyme
MLKYQFDDQLPHQIAAIDATISLFDYPDAPRYVPYTGEIGGGFYVNNVQHLPVPLDIINQRIANLAKQNNYDPIEIEPNNPIRFSIEMETGTGKTYVYIRTLLELFKTYGYTRFIIVVPTLPIRSGVRNTLKHLKKHFSQEENLYFEWDEYSGESSNTSTIQWFCDEDMDGFPKILLMTTGAFRNPKTNRLYHDTISGFVPDRPIDWLKAVRPIVVLDEPQKTKETSNTIQQLYTSIDPLFTLGYSATHKENFPLLYKLNPFDAMEQNLVKRLYVRTLDTSSQGEVRLVGFEHDKGKLYAKVAYKKLKDNELIDTTSLVSKADELYQLSNKNLNYESFGKIANMDKQDGWLEFEGNGERLFLSNALTEPIQREMIAQTIKLHLEKRLECDPKGIKVISLFFIDNVADYRDYTRNEHGKGRLSEIFEEEYNKLVEPYRNQLNIHYVQNVHEGSFAIDDKTKKPIDLDKLSSKDRTKQEASAYEKIIELKEQLLHPDEPLSFIFAHSRLKEGWDCPNVFQICTLKDSNNSVSKRQEIGRGMRLAVAYQPNGSFTRLSGDSPINTLRLITTETYSSYIETLRNEYIKAGYKLDIADLDTLTRLIPYSYRFNDKDKDKELMVNVTRRYLKNCGLVEDVEGCGLIWNVTKLENKDKAKKSIEEALKPIQDLFPELDVKSYAENLAQSIKGLKNLPMPDNVKRIEPQVNTKFLENPTFKELWQRINQKALYRFNINQDGDVDELVKTICQDPNLKKALFDFGKNAIKIVEAQANIRQGTGKVIIHQDTLTNIQNQYKPIPTDWLQTLAISVKLQRPFVLSIIQALANHYKDKVSVYKWLVTCPDKAKLILTSAINDSMVKLTVKGLQYNKLNSLYHAEKLLEPIEVGEKLHSNMIQNLDKTYFLPIPLDSNTEVKEHENLDESDKVKVYIKLPSRFKVMTPYGSYNPDWAIVEENGKKVFLVKETKARKQGENRPAEEGKITCAEKLYNIENKDLRYESGKPLGT